MSDPTSVFARFRCVLRPEGQVPAVPAPTVATTRPDHGRGAYDRCSKAGGHVALRRSDNYSNAAASDIAHLSAPRRDDCARSRVVLASPVEAAAPKDAR